jgi:hypothetical protein
MILRYEDTKFYDDAAARAERATVTCECGSDKLYVNFLNADFSGCYLKLTCVVCGAREVIFDDFS